MIRDKFWESTTGWYNEEYEVICANCGLRFGDHQYNDNTRLYDNCPRKQGHWLAPEEATEDQKEWANSLKKWRNILDA